MGALWKVEFEDLGEGKARLIRHLRADDGTRVRPGKTQVFRLREEPDNPKRIVTHIQVGLEPRLGERWKADEVFEVVNPANVFSYKGE
jgi:hypothetical protein